MRRIRIALTTVLATIGLTLLLSGVASAQSERILVRVEGATRTIFEGYVRTAPQEVTTESGGTHECNGLNGGANPEPGATATTALANAAAKGGFTFNGNFDSEFGDFFISRIAENEQTATEFWGLLVNDQFTPVSGCEQEVTPGEEVLWAYNAFNAVHFLKLTRGKHRTVIVTDGSTGEPIAGATVGPVENSAGVTTNANGEATLSFTQPGAHRVKASAPESIRSNSLVIHTPFS
jgi:hypothetical protein